MGDGPQQIAAHFLLLRLGPDLFLLLELRRHRADDDGDGDHDEEGQGIAGDREIQGEIGVGEHVIDADDADHRGDQTVEIPVGVPGDENDGGLENQSGINVAFAEEPQHAAEQHGQGENPDADERIPPGGRKELACRFPTHGKQPPCSFVIPAQGRASHHIAML